MPLGTVGGATPHRKDHVGETVTIAGLVTSGCAALSEDQAREAMEGLSDAVKEVEKMSDEFTEAMEEAAEEAERQSATQPNTDSEHRPDPPVIKQPYDTDYDDIDRPDYPNRESFEFDQIDDGFGYDDLVDYYEGEFGDGPVERSTVDESNERFEEMTTFESPTKRVAVLKTSPVTTDVVVWYAD